MVVIMFNRPRALDIPHLRKQRDKKGALYEYIFKLLHKLCAKVVKCVAFLKFCQINLHTPGL